MKSLLIALSFFSGVLPTIVNAQPPSKVPVNIYHTYLPTGFDSNDGAEVFVSGALPNTCYKNPFSVVKQVGNKIEIEVMAYYQGGEEAKCAEMLVPFLEKVELGVLDKGNYSVLATSGPQVLKVKDLKITESTSNSIDDFVYASVDYIEDNQFNRTVKLNGYNPSDCYVFEKVEVISNKDDTYSILPIMKKISDFCPMKGVAFSYEVEIPKDLKKNTVLLHVRTMDGRSINRLFAKYRQ